MTSLFADQERPPFLSRLLFLLLIVGIAFAFQGSRGLAEPDEGRYANAAVEMMHSGDWLIPRLHGLIYLDKPPGVYWSIAAGIRILGANEWGARLGHGLALVATALILAAWAGREWGQKVGRLAGVAYVTALGPAVAGSILTPDSLLTLWTTACSFAYWRSRQAQSGVERWRWALVLGLSAGAGVLTKGPAALVLLVPVVVHVVWQDGPLGIVRRPELSAAAALGLGIGAWWYWKVAEVVPGAAAYFLDNQVTGRLFEDTYHRNPEWWAPITVYGSVLVVGTLPWSIAWWRSLRSPDRRECFRTLWRNPMARYLLLATVLPLVIFSLAKSRLPLYVLPVLPFLVLLSIFLATREEGPSPWSRRVLVPVLLILGLKLLSALAPLDRDGGQLAQALHRAGVESTDCIDALGVKAHGLCFYSFDRVTWHTPAPETYPYFQKPHTLAEDLPSLLRECGQRIRFLVRAEHSETGRRTLAGTHLDCIEVPLNTRYEMFDCSGAAR